MLVFHILLSECEVSQTGPPVQILDQIPFPITILAALTLGLAPFTPEPHIVEKLRMLFQGALVRPVDWFDLALHAAPFVLLALKLIRLARA